MRTRSARNTPQAPVIRWAVTIKGTSTTPTQRAVYALVRAPRYTLDPDPYQLERRAADGQTVLERLGRQCEVQMLGTVARVIERVDVEIF